MKKVFMTIASSMMLVACEKAIVDTPAIESEQEVVKNGAVTLKAIMPEFTADTKATIADNGVFSWADGENPDIIAVRYVKEGAEDEYVSFECTNASDCEFTGTPTEGYSIATSGNIAFYPYEYRGTASPYSGSADNASKSFQMKANGFVDGKLNFEHDNALLKVTVNNIPSIATSLVIGSANVSVSLEKGGNIIVYVPALAADAAALTIRVKQGDDVLFQKSTSKSVAIEKGYIYTHIPPLTVTPEAVYCVRSLDGDNWSNNSTTQMSVPTENTSYSTTIKSYGGGSKYFRVNVKYPEKVAAIEYGNNDENADGSAGGTFVSGKNYASIIDVYGLHNYSITFDYLSGEYTISDSPISLYVIGTMNDWKFNNTLEMTRVIGDYYCWNGTNVTANSEAKVYEEGVTDWGSGGTYPGSNITGLNGTFTLFVNSSDFGAHFKQTGFNKNSITLKGTFDNWSDGISFTKTSYKGIWMISNQTFSSEVTTKLVIDNQWTGVETDGTLISGNRIYDLKTVGQGNNFKIGAGTYNIGYNDNTNTLYFEKL